MNLRNLLKRLANSLFFILALPIYLIYQIESLIIGQEKAFRGVSQFVSLFPGLLGMYWRRAFYVLALKHCSWDCDIGFGVLFSHSSAEIGKHVYIGSRSTLGDIVLGDYATLGSNVDIMNGGKQHYINDLNTPLQEQGGEYPKVFIGNDTWIGNSCVVMASIGKKSVIGAGSVVVHDIGDFEIAVGNPAQCIKKRR